MISNRQIAHMVRKLSLNNGDVLMVKSGSGLAEHSVLDTLAKHIESMTSARILIVVVDDFKDMSKITEKEMNRLGWFHIDAIAKLLRLKEELEKDGNSDKSGEGVRVSIDEGSGSDQAPGADVGEQGKADIS